MAYAYDTPEALAATAISNTQITLTWTNTESVTIRVQRKASGGTYQSIHLGDSSTETYADTTVSGNTAYTYRIRYDFGGGTSDWSDEASATSYPNPPTGLTVTYSGKTATLAWGNGSVYDYIYSEYKASSDESWTTDSTTLSGTATTRNITVATESALYDFRVAGYNSTADKLSSYETESNQRSGVMAPTNLLLTSASTTSVTATWTDNSSVEDGYEVYYGDTLFATTAADATTSTITGLTAGTAYTIKVRAKDGSYYSAYATDSITTGTVPNAAAVIGTVTVVGQTALTPTWTCAATNETGFTVHRSTDDTTYAEIGTAAANATSYADTGLTSNTTYYYKVRAYNASGVSALSSAASGATEKDLDPPTALYAEALSSTQIKIYFTVNAGDASSHSVERKPSGGSYSVIGSTADGTTATYTDGTCSANTEYTYRIRPYHSGSTTYGDYSVTVTKTTLNVGTGTVRRNEAYFAMGNVLCVVSETPQNDITAYWLSKPIDCIEIDARDANKYKTFYKVQLEYEDKYADVPVSISLSTDGGVTWKTTTETMGTGSGLDKVQDFWFYGVTGRNVTAMVLCQDTDTTFSWTALTLEYEPMGEYVTT